MSGSVLEAYSVYGKQQHFKQQKQPHQSYNKRTHAHKVHEYNFMPKM